MFTLSEATLELVKVDEKSKAILKSAAGLRDLYLTYFCHEQAPFH